MLMHYILVFVVMVERLMRKQKIKIVNSDALALIEKLCGPIIFAPTHVGKYDIQVLTEVLWKFRWHLLSGDPYDLPGTVEGYWLKLNGVVYVDRDDKAYRNNAKQDMINLLNKGENIMLYPEGTWNFSQNQPVLPLFRGIADVAVTAQATIVPFGLEVDVRTNTYHVMIGGPIAPIGEPLALLENVRNQMATLKWKLFECLQNNRVSYDKASLVVEWNEYIRTRLSECSYMNYDLIWKYARKESWQIEKESIQTDMLNIQTEIHNAFLLNKRLK